MKVLLDSRTLHTILDSKRVREEKVPPTPLQRGYALSSLKRDSRPQLPFTGQGPVTPLEAKFPVSDELHLLELQIAGYLLETALEAADLPAGETASIHDRFCGRLFDLQDLRVAIEEIQAHTPGHSGASSVKAVL